MLMGRILDFLTPGATDAAPAKAADRRIAQRRSVLFRATIYPVDVFCDARICDISATGLRGESELELAIGQTLHLTADGHSYHAGVVKWTHDRQFGLGLTNAVGIFEGSAPATDHGQHEGHHPRASRSRVNMAVRIVVGRPPRPATIRNLSATGMLIDTSAGLKPGQHLVVRVGSVTPIYGRAQWSVGGKIGLKSLHPMSVLSVACTVD